MGKLPYAGKCLDPDKQTGAGFQQDATDVVLVSLAQKGNTFAEELLVNRYTPMVYSFTRNCYRDGWERADFAQEAFFGLIRAIRSFDQTRSPLFSTYAALCIRSELHDALRRALSKKSDPLSGYVSLSDDLGATGELFVDTFEQLFDGLAARDDLSDLTNRLSTLLSPFEKKVFAAYVKGFAFPEIADALGKSPKSIDNAFTRIRRKAQGLRS